MGAGAVRKRKQFLAFSNANFIAHRTCVPYVAVRDAYASECVSFGLDLN